MAALVTVTDALLAFPIAYYMARVASPRDAGHAGRGGADAALGGVPGQGLRVADHPPGQRPRSSGSLGAVRHRRPGSRRASPTRGWCFSYLWLPYMILPIYAGLERIPTSLLEASADLGGATGTTFRRVILPLVFPALVAGSIFTFSLTLGRLHHARPGLGREVHRQRHLRQLEPRQPAPGGGVLAAADRDHDRLPARRPPPRRVRVAVSDRPMTESRAVRIAAARGDGGRPGLPLPAARRPGDLRLQPEPDQAWPPTGFTLHWFVEAGEQPGRHAGRRQLARSSRPWRPAIALVLGTLAALAVQRYAFFGRQTISFFLVLPIALPGVVTGIALRTSFVTFGVEFGLLTIVVGHATFCVVVVYNNVIARLRRLPRSPEEASADLGADAFTTFRRVTLPGMRHRPAVRRPAGVRPVVRRDHRHELHGRCRHPDDPDVDPVRPSSARRAAGRERRRAGPDDLCP